MVENPRFAVGIVGDISTSGLDGHIVSSGCPSMSHLFVDTFCEFGVVENFVQKYRNTYFRFIQLYESVTMTMCSR